jgi:radical SAM superfamily enzyme YgiQ (UPF0313 family)
MTPWNGVPAISLAYLVSSLKAAGHSVVGVIDAYGEAMGQFAKIEGTSFLVNGLTAAEIAARIPRDTDVVGVSCMFSNEWIYAKQVIREIRREMPDVVIVGGGEHFTADSEYSLRACPEIHSLVLGEGEETFVDLVGAVLAGRSLESVPGIAYLADGRFARTPPRARVRAIDGIPLPSWDEMPLERYLDAGIGMGSVGKRSMPMIATRGCPFACTFCSSPTMWTQRWVAREPKQVVNEIKTWIARYGVSNVEFYDLTAIVRRDWIIRFAQLLIEEDLRITWALPSGTRSEALDAEVMRYLRLSGCRSLTYAPESGSPATLHRIKKKIKLPHMLESMRAGVKEGLHLKANMIVGLPGQTYWEVAESYALIARMAWVGVDDVAVFPFVPYPGSELFAQLIEQGKITRAPEEYDRFLAANVYNEVSGTLSWSEHISHRHIKILTLGGMAWFYALQFLFRPWRAGRVLSRVIRQSPITMLERALHLATRKLISKRRNVSAALEHVQQHVDPAA